MIPGWTEGAAPPVAVGRGGRAGWANCPERVFGGAVHGFPIGRSAFRGCPGFAESGEPTLLPALQGPSAVEGADLGLAVVPVRGAVLKLEHLRCEAVRHYGSIVADFAPVPTNETVTGSSVRFVNVIGCPVAAKRYAGRKPFDV